MKVNPKNAVARLVIRDVDKMKKREIQSVCAWLLSQRDHLLKDYEEYPDHFTSTLLYKKRPRNGTSARNNKQ